MEWDDIEAAISHVSDQHELAVLSVVDGPGDERRYDMVTVLDEPVRITFTRLPDDDPDEATPAKVTIQVGLFGDPAREAGIFDTLRERLAWLIIRD